MTNREALLSLAERVEGLSGPNRELGREVLLACGWTKTCVGHFIGAMYHWRSPDGKISFDDDNFHRHDPTASIDSAMSLVGYQCGRPHNVVIATGHGSAYIVPNDGASYGVNDDLCVRGRASGDDEVGRTARAITAASLRAIGEGL